MHYVLVSGLKFRLQFQEILPPVSFESQSAPWGLQNHLHFKEHYLATMLHLELALRLDGATSFCHYGEQSYFIN